MRTPRQEQIEDACLQLQEALRQVDKIVAANSETYADEKRPSHARRKYTLADARRHARMAARNLRDAWENLDSTADHWRVG